MTPTPYRCADCRPSPAKGRKRLKAPWNVHKQLLN